MIRPAAVGLLLLLFGFRPGAKAQEIETPEVELYGGHDYVRYRINGVPPSESFNANGISGQAVYNPNSRLRSWANSVIIHWHVWVAILHTKVSYLLGARVSLRRHIVTPFAQVLFGAVWAADGVTLGPVTAFGMTAGGGIDIRVWRYFAVRPLQAEYFMTKFPDGANDRQNNFRFGKRGEKVLKKSEVAAVVPALGASLLPSLSCPACWPSYASLLSAIGLSFLSESKYLLWLNVIALIVSLIVLARRTRHASYVPLLIGAPAALLILFGRFLLNSNPVTWLGAASQLAAFVWSKPRAKSAGCPTCFRNTSLEEVEHGIKAS